MHSVQIGVLSLAGNWARFQPQLDYTTLHSCPASQSSLYDAVSLGYSSASNSIAFLRSNQPFIFYILPHVLYTQVTVITELYIYSWHLFFQVIRNEYPGRHVQYSLLVYPHAISATKRGREPGAVRAKPGGARSQGKEDIVPGSVD